MFEITNQIWYDVTVQVKPGQNRAQNSDGDIQHLGIWIHLGRSFTDSVCKLAGQGEALRWELAGHQTSACQSTLLGIMAGIAKDHVQKLQQQQPKE